MNAAWSMRVEQAKVPVQPYRALAKHHDPLRYWKRTRSNKVLVLGDDTRSFLGVVRSLGRRGIEVHGAWVPPSCPSVSSRYLVKVHDLPSYRVANDAWFDALVGVLEREQFDLVIPCNDPSILPLRERRASLERSAPLALIGDRAFEVTSDKAETALLARRLGIPVPREVRASSPFDAARIADELGLPVVLKPLSSFTMGDLTQKRKVVRVDSVMELESMLTTMLRGSESILAQEHFTGTGVGVNVLADHGEVLSAFQHVRVHEPLGGGGSSYRESTPLDPELTCAARALMKSLDYTGVAMIEFRKNMASGAWILIEINGRFWGSLPLAIAAGADFPYWLHALLVDGRRDFPRSYTVGLRARNTAGDVQWLLERVAAGDGIASIKTLLREAPALARGNERNDTLVIDDVLPGIVEAEQIVTRFASSAIRRAKTAALTSAPVRAIAIRRTRSRLNSARRVLFVCKGNICRSPFAEAFASAALGDPSRVRSCGYFPVAGRRPPEIAVLVARDLGVDLTRHRSRVVTPAMLEEADVVLTFDEENVETLVERFPFARRKIALFGLVTSRVPLFVADPYGGEEETFRRTYNAIARGIADAMG